MAEGYQSLYRRYRSKRFSELKGQDHVVRALRTAVSEDRVGHAYLFSGPRGTGKTSTARILAKVLNCEHPVDGEPDGTCPNCLAVDDGRIVDWLLELDAASNNGVANIRELIERIPLGTSGNRKVVILDEVHMLSTGASNALLKSLEEPPSHVVFILATTDPQKVLPTIRSRTQHFEFHLLPADVLADHVRHVIADAGLELGEDAVDHVVRQGGGSARDTLSALDQVSAMGGVVEQAHPVEAILAALTAHDPGAALVAVADAADAGRDPRALGEVLIAALRDAFLAVMGSPDRHLPPGDLERAAALGEALGAAGLTRALEVLGEALVDLAKKPDPRIVLEVALIRLCRPDADHSLDAVLERLERLERAVASGGVVAPAAAAPAPPGAHAAPTAAPAAPAPAPPAPSGGSPADQARAALAEAKAAAPVRARVTKATSPRADAAPTAADPAAPPTGPAAAAAPTPTSAPAPAPASAPTPAPATTTGGIPSRDELTLVWGDAVLDQLPRGTKAIYSTGRFVESSDSAAVFALANAPTRDHCEKKRPDVEKALAAHFGRPVPLKLVTDAEVGGAPPAPAAPPSGPAPAVTQDEVDEVGDVHALEDAPSASSGAERLAEAFPGAELIDE
jgi:DNA polymerase-3 subunit gamma/tau